MGLMAVGTITFVDPQLNEDDDAEAVPAPDREDTPANFEPDYDPRGGDDAAILPDLNPSAADSVVLTEGSSDADTLYGNDGNDRTRGQDGADTISGGNGNDELRGDDGNDLLRGDAGNDTLHGNDGADIINGGAQDDEIFGHNADDFLSGDEAMTRCKGQRATIALRGVTGTIHFMAASTMIH